MQGTGFWVCVRENGYFVAEFEDMAAAMAYVHRISKQRCIQGFRISVEV